MEKTQDSLDVFKDTANHFSKVMLVNAATIQFRVIIDSQEDSVQTRAINDTLDLRKKIAVGILNSSFEGEELRDAYKLLLRVNEDIKLFLGLGKRERCLGI